jgi:hypothetical protein
VGHSEVVAVALGDHCEFRPHCIMLHRWRSDLGIMGRRNRVSYITHRSLISSRRNLYDYAIGRLDKDTTYKI